MSSEWPLVKLEEVTSILGDGLHGTPQYDDEGEYYFINGSNLKDGRIEINESTKRVSAHEYEKHKKNLNSKTILVSINGTLGNVSLYSGEKVVLGKSACYFNVMEGVDKHFVRYVVSGNVFQDYLSSLATGSTIKNVSLRLMRDFSFKLPPFPVQLSIADMLKSLDDRITLLRETNKTLESIAQAIFKSWFVDFDPVYAKAKGLAPEGMDEATATLFPDSFEETELGMVPKGWSFCSLKEVTAIFDSIRIPLSSGERDKRKGSYPYYGAAALMDYVDDYLFDGIYLLIGEDGSVTDKAGYPVTQYVWGKFWVNNHAHVLQGKNCVSTEHLMLALKRINIQPYITGAVQAKLSQSNMWRIKILQPTSNISQHFGDTIKPLFDTIRSNFDRTTNLASLRDTLLPRLISGQLRIEEAQEMVESV
jgi:restriction endonuclease S subunit